MGKRFGEDELNKARAALDELEQALPFYMPKKDEERDLIIEVSNLKESIARVAKFADDSSMSYMPRDWRAALIRIAKSLNTLSGNQNGK